jgi:MoaA/NifB/PqqE/SkfB family radical SAM enzyme
MQSVRRFERRLARGESFPAFLFISVTDRCNLRCQGCWVTPAGEPRELPAGELDALIAQCKRHGTRVFGLLGGEPLLYRHLFETLEAHRDCYFVLFTNGTLLDDGTAAAMRRVGNVTPLVSLEGDEEVSDVRRGGTDVFRRTMDGLAACRRHRLVTGVATSVCRSNIDELVTEAFVQRLVDAGAHYVWYYVYRPVGAEPRPELALSKEQILRLRRFIVDIRRRAPIIVVDTYWDHAGRAVCPAAMGVGYHVSPQGYVEPCPPVQFAVERVDGGGDLYRRIAGSDFLRGFRELAARTTRGCILMERPDLLAAYVAQSGAVSTSGRGDGVAELKGMCPCAGHGGIEEVVPERSLLYRFAKRHWFFGFGAYG